MSVGVGERVLGANALCPQPSLCGTLLGPRAHVCAFFRSVADRDRVLLPFIRDGLIAGEKIVQTIDPGRRNAHVGQLLASGIDFEAAHRQGRFELYDWTQTHLGDGGFEALRTLDFFKRVRERARDDGFPMTRFVTHMEWALENGVKPLDLLAYESQANRAWLGATGPVNPVICTYDLTKFSAEFIVEVMRTHPLTLIDGILQENPFFSPPEEFAIERHEQHIPSVARAGGKR